MTKRTNTPPERQAPMIAVYPPYLLDPERLCTCLHRWGGHVPDTRAYYDSNNPTASAHAGPCAKCRCQKFEDRVAWRVQGDSQSSWAVVTPSGRRMWAAPSAAAAHQVAHSMAAIDEMMARIARAEGTLYGNTPTLKRQVRRPPPPVMHPGPAAVVVHIR